ncbi:MAG: hypothetical protein HQK98_03405 [Nitrospirae bacterium]|nr:hypothetical protein [Nitrospirota bacterium]
MLKYKIADNILNKSNYYYVLLIVLLLLSIIYVFMSLPLQVGDADIWIHLGGGWYFSTHGSLESDSHFSFIQPQRHLINYPWLFQVIVYKIYSFTGEQGLVAFRTLSFISILLLILLFLYKRQKENIYYVFFVIIVYAAVLMSRYSVLRPHVFSYALIAAFLYVLEYYPRKTFILPILALLWSNVHGITYPVMLLILLAYGAEPSLLRIWPGLCKDDKNKSNTLFTLPLVIAMMMIFVTPNGLALIETPFNPVNFAETYIVELRKYSINELLPMFLSLISPTSMLVLIAFLSFFRSLLNKSIRLAHALLFVGGTILLLKGIRFLNEFILLALPIVATTNPFENLLHPINKSGKAKIFFLAINTIVFILSLSSLDNHLSTAKKANINIPWGVAQFLLGLDAGGNIVNEPNYGGYMKWMLYPKYKIFMDMQVPNLFTDVDVYAGFNVFKEDIVLKKIIEKYNPDFFSVPFKYRVFSNLIKRYPNYTAIFFDDADVLYINKNIYPKIADQYDLKELDPFALGSDLMEQVNIDKSDNYTAELKRIYDIYPSLISSLSLARIYNQKGQYEHALPYTDVAIKNFPEIPATYNMKAETLSGLHKYKEAIKVLDVALSKARDLEKQGIYHQLYICYFNLGDKKRAYKALKKSVDVYSQESSYEDIYNLAALSIIYGQPSDPQTLFNISLLKLPPEREDLRVKIETALKAIKK